MVMLKTLATALSAFAAINSASALFVGGKHMAVKPYERELLQDIVTWDEHSLFVRGERIMFHSGEFHPFRLPVPGLWLDVFQKIKALGYSGVSFYVDWALLEGNPGHFTAEGVFALEPFFDAAVEAGIYLLARPGPYINAEASGGGFPGWLQRNPAILRTNETAYLEATNNYAKSVGEIIAAGQITNGGPVILLQPENEYSEALDDILFPDYGYLKYVEDQFRDAGITVPFIVNDAGPNGYAAPGTGIAAVDIYGHDGYPLGFDCANPTTWPTNGLPTNYHVKHLQQSPSTPYSLVEFQGGSFDPWAGEGFEKCADLLNHEFERVFYKNDFSFGVTIFNLYMTYGGTNWGNLGFAQGYTSYDYGAAISEDRRIYREKYSEAKLEANFLKVSPAYLTATPGNYSAGGYVDTTDITTTPLFGNGSDTNFYVVRHSDYTTLASTDYTLSVTTSAGDVTIPQLGGTLTLNGRDSKIHVTDYDVGGINVLYSSAEIFTWGSYSNKTVLVLYGGEDETHEAAFTASGNATLTSGSDVTIESGNGTVILNWNVTADRKVVSIGSNLVVYLLWRNEAYNFWGLELEAEAPVGNFTSPSKSHIIASSGYLLRTAAVDGTTLSFSGDYNASTTLEVVGGAPSGLTDLYFNGESVDFTQGSDGVVTASLEYSASNPSLPDLSSLEWKYIDSLPEITSSYDDSKWTDANLTFTYDTLRNITTPTSLYGGDYGYTTGNLVFRAHFTANGEESSLYISHQGGDAYGASYWIDDSFIGFWGGDGSIDFTNQTVEFASNLTSGTDHVLTVLLDNNGLDEDWTIGTEQTKDPRGILDYTLSGHDASDLTWKITGNLGGEDYADLTRGPLNEGGLYAERQGYHLPQPPSSNWTSSSPYDGIDSAGVAFYTTSFDLDIPEGRDIPLAFVFDNSTQTSGNNWRSQLYVNGYQFGKYINNIGPQTTFPVPEGILNHHGTNYIALSLWAQDAEGAAVPSFELQATADIVSGYTPPALAPQPAWSLRANAY